jgi:hypothetical protein
MRDSAQRGTRVTGERCGMVMDGRLLRRLAHLGVTRHPLGSMRGRSQVCQRSIAGSGTGCRLLIRGFGVRVPGGAPVLTWGFTLQVILYVPFVPMFAPCSLVSPDSAIRGLSKIARPAPDPGLGAPTLGIASRPTPPCLH